MFSLEEALIQLRGTTSTFTRTVCIYSFLLKKFMNSPILFNNLINFNPRCSLSLVCSFNHCSIFSGVTSVVFTSKLFPLQSYKFFTLTIISYVLSIFLNYFDQWFEITAWVRVVMLSISFWRSSWESKIYDKSKS